MDINLADCLKQVVVSRNTVIGILDDCLMAWGSSGQELKNISESLQKKLDEDPNYMQLVERVIVEAVGISGLIVTLESGFDFKAQLTNFLPTAEDKPLNYLKKEIATRGVLINQNLKKITGLTRQNIDRRLQDYVGV